MKPALLACALLTAACRAQPPASAPLPARPPNVVLLYADDLGYGDIGCYGATRQRTPCLDRMAAEGMRFTSFYSCAPLCTPSRAGLLTGRYPIRMGLARVIYPRDRFGIPDDETTLAEALRARGYATACVGKWHLGHHLPQFFPTRHGFDRWFGLPYSNDMRPTPLYRDETVLEQPVAIAALTRRYTEEAVRFISDSRDRPFFLYVPYTMPHEPLAASDAFKGRSAGGLYGDAIEELDWSVGEIFGALRRLGLDERTLAIFSSDNGPWLVKGVNPGSAGALRGAKATTFEGGIRVPCVVRWPGRVPAGRVESRPAIMLDWFPTVTALAGGAPPGGHPTDGRDIRGMLSGTGVRGEEEFFFYRNESLEAHRSGPWKLKRAPARAAGGGEGPPMLFNVEEDPSERRDLAGERPEIAERLRRQMEAFEQRLAGQ